MTHRISFFLLGYLINSRVHCWQNGWCGCRNCIVIFTRCRFLKIKRYGGESQRFKVQLRNRKHLSCLHAVIETRVQTRVPHFNFSFSQAFTSVSIRFPTMSLATWQQQGRKCLDRLLLAYSKTLTFYVLFILAHLLSVRISFYDLK